MIAGDPGGVEAGAAVLGRGAADLVEAGESVLSHGRVITADWAGNSADAAGVRIEFLGRRTRIGGEVAAGAVPVLMDYAQELRMAQAQYAAGAAQAAAGESALQAATLIAPEAAVTAPPEALSYPVGGRAVAEAHGQISAGQHEMTAAVAREERANAEAARRITALTAELADMTAEVPPVAPPVPFTGAAPAWAWSGAVADLFGSRRKPDEVEALALKLQQARLAGKDPASYKNDLLRYRELRAAQVAGIDLATWDPAAGVGANSETIDAVYDFYGQLYLDNPDMEWAGLANMVGPGFAAGFRDLQLFGAVARAVKDGDVVARDTGKLGADLSRLPEEVLDAVAGMSEKELQFYETKLLKMQKDIFMDMAPVHQAYADGGIAAVEEMAAAGIVTPVIAAAWRDIDSGDPVAVRDGALALAHYEQKDIIQADYRKMYGRYPSGEAFTYAMTVVGRPSVPGAQVYAEFDPLTVTVLESPGFERIRTPDRIGTLENIGPFDVPSVGFDIPSVDVDNPLQGSVDVVTSLPAGNIALFEDRWEMFLADILPAYQRLLDENPGVAEEIISGDVAGRTEEYRILNRTDEIREQLTDLDLKLSQ